MSQWALPAIAIMLLAYGEATFLAEQRLRVATLHQQR